MVYPPPVEIVMSSDFNQVTVRAEVRSDILQVKVVVDPGPTSLASIVISEIGRINNCPIAKKPLKRLSLFISQSDKLLKQHV